LRKSEKTFCEKKSQKVDFILLPQLNFVKKAKAERKFIKEGKRRNAYAFQVFLTLRNFLYDKHWLARFGWGSNNITSF